MGPLQGRDGTTWQAEQGDQLRNLRALCLAVLVVGAALTIAPVGTAAAANTVGEDGIVFVDTNGNLKSVTQSGTVVDYGIDGPAAVGPAADIDGDSIREVPFVTSNGKIKIVDDEGEVQQLGDYSAVSPRKSSTKLAIGDWDEDGNYDVFFASQESGQNIYRVDWDERNDQPENLGLFDADAAQFMLGSTDITGDGIRDLVFVSSSSSLYYVNGTGNDVLLTSSTKWGSNNNIGLGEPADFDDSGGDSPTPADFEYPRVDGSNNAGYLSNDESLTKTTYSGTSAKKGPPTAADITGDGVADHVYIGSNNGYLRYKQDPAFGGANGTVTDSNGNELSADASVGLVGRISSFTERESITSSGKNARDTTAPTIDDGSVAADNSYVEVTITEGVYANADGTSGLSASNLTVTLTGDSDGSVTRVSIAGVTQTDGTATEGGENTVRATLSISGTASGDETVEVGPTDGSSVYDSAGNAMADSQSTGALSLSDQQAPGDPTSTSPADDADGVATDTTVDLTFGEDVQTATGSVTVKRTSDDSTVEAIGVTTNQVTVSGQTVTVDPSSALEDDTDYYVTVDSGAIEDTAGNAYPGFTDSTTLNFTTVDTTSPTVTDGTVAGDNSYVDVTVSEGVYANADGTSGVAASDFEAVLSGDSDSSVSAVSVDGVTRTDDSATTGGETTVRVSLSLSGTASGDETVAVGPADGSSVYDSAGNAMADTQSTGALSLSDQQAPGDPTSTSPADDADGVATDTTVDLTFGEDVQTATGSITVKRTSDDNTVEAIDVTTNQVTVSGKTVTVDPSTALEDDTDYYITVDSGAIEDTAGNAYPGFTDSTTLNFTTVDLTAPTIESFVVTNPSDQRVTVTVESDEPLATVEATITGAGSTTLSTAHFTASSDGGTETYTATYDAGGDGDYTAALTAATDAAGNDGAAGQSDTVTVSTPTEDDDTTAPKIRAVSANVTNRSVVVTVESDEHLATVEATVQGRDSTTLSTDAFTESTDGATATYTASYTPEVAGSYDIELTAAVDEAGNDAADGQAATATVEVVVPADQFTLTGADDGLRVSLRSRAALDALTVSVGGPENATLPLSAFEATTTSDGDIVYAATVSTTVAGSYTATLTEGTVDGRPIATGQTDTTERTNAFTLDPRASSYDVAAGSNVTLRAGGDVPADAEPTYEWDIDGDGETDRRGQTITAAFDEPGRHAVDLVAVADGRTLTDSVTVSVRNQTEPTAGVDRRTLDFGRIAVGETARMNVTVYNPEDAGADYTISGSSLVGQDPEAFAVGGDRPVTLAPGDRHSVTVSFTPTSNGAKTAQLQLLPADSSNPQLTVWLSSERSYILVEPVPTNQSANATVSVDAYNVDTDERLDVNVSQPDSRRQVVSVDELGMTPAGDDTFGMAIVHAPTPPTPSSSVHDPESGRQNLQYIRLNHRNNDSLRFGDTALRYRVKTAALPEGSSPESVALSRWNGTAWNFSATGRLVERTDGYYVYRVETPGFSQFVVTGPTENASSAAASSQTTTDGDGSTVDDGATEPAVDDGATDDGATDDEGNSLSGVVLLLVGGGGLVAILVVLLAWRRRDDEDEDDPLADEQVP